ncbi:hypothetical protein [Massilia sp. NR 4-1]|uniref:hypothetical protein n=1 Tax=Massilia sp. NR 4-1 TaxID=1678028 RepID=UPI000ADD3D63|nr:hypothetical protein [Massilia sp. NR 4-1]
MSCKKIFCAIATMVMLAGCATRMKVAEVDPTTGLLKSEVGTVSTATVVTSKQMSLAPFKGMVFISGSQASIDQMRKIGYFDEVMDLDDLQKLIISNNLQDKVPSLNDKIGLNKLYRAYKPFLWVYFKRITKENKPYMQLVATNPDTLEDVFVSEVYLDFVWSGVNDQNSRYPLFNALISWINQNKA